MGLIGRDFSHVWPGIYLLSHFFRRVVLRIFVLTSLIHGLRAVDWKAEFSLLDLLSFNEFLHVLVFIYYLNKVG